MIELKLQDLIWAGGACTFYGQGLRLRVACSAALKVERLRAPLLSPCDKHHNEHVDWTCHRAHTD